MNIGVKLQRINQEDFIWVIYFFIVIAALISNNFERNYILKRNPQDQKNFRLINITVLIVVFFIYLYFVIINYEDIHQLRKSATKKEVITLQASLIAFLLFLVGTVFALWAEINRSTSNENVDII